MKPQIHSGTGLDLRLPRPLDLKRHVPLPLYRRSAEAVPAPRLFLWTPKAIGLLAQQMLSSWGREGRESAASGETRHNKAMLTVGTSPMAEREAGTTGPHHKTLKH